LILRRERPDPARNCALLMSTVTGSSACSPTQPRGVEHLDVIGRGVRARIARRSSPATGSSDTNLTT
jgi:hypothetical protein